jgi:serine/threonine protein kinase/Leucine-rich repeat (LRR) protein
MAVALEQFVKQLTDSGVIAPGKLENFVPPKAYPKDAQELAKQLVQSKQLTKFQAQEIYAGRARGLILGNYTLLEKIGSGGMGQVFKAQHRRMERVVAIKMLPATTVKDAAAAARFQREVVAAAKLSHPNIVAAYDADEAGGIHFLVMEYAQGSDLSALVKKNGPISADKAVNYIQQAARGLEYAHKHGVIHRDIKPANLLLDTEGTVKILDMGLARIEAASDTATQAELTGTGAVMGTVDYMAPEQALSTKHADARSDIYGLGCTLFYLLSGHAAYDGDSLMAKLLAHREQPIPAIAANSPDEVQAVFQKMVAKRAADRYQTMSEVVAALEQCNAGQPSSIGLQHSVSTNVDADVLTFLRDIPTHTTNKPKAKPAKSATPLKSAERRAGTAHLAAWIRGKNKWILGGVAAAVLGLAILAAVVVKLRTPDGTLLVEINQPDAAVQVLSDRGKVEISQPGGKGTLSISVDPGKHRLRVEKAGFAIFTKEVSIESGGTQSVKAILEPRKNESLAANADPDRRAAEWVVKKGGTVELTQGDKKIRAKALADLPNGKFTLHHVNLDGLPLQIRDEDLPEIQNIDSLNCCIPNISEQSVRCISRLLRLTFLNLNGTRITDRGLAYLRSLRELRNLGLHDAGRITAAGVAELQEALPNCKIDWNDPAKAMSRAKPLATFSDPAFLRWEKVVAALPAEKQVEAVRKKLMELNPGFDGKLAGYQGVGTPKIENGVVISIHLLTDNVNDISPLRVLSGLTVIQCGGSTGDKRSGFSDLSPLEGMQLTMVVCSNTRVSDLSPLKGNQINHINCYDTPVSDLSPLEECKNLEYLFAGKTQVTEAGVAALQRAVPKCKIEWDRPAQAKNSWESPAFKQWEKQVAAMPAAKQVEAVSKKLHELNSGFDGKVTGGYEEATPKIDNGVVTSFGFGVDNVTDISPVRALTGLKVLRCVGSDEGKGKLSDLAPLQDMPLTLLDCSQTQLSDLSPLKGMKLTLLGCHHTQIRDLSPLEGMPLTWFECSNTQVSDLSPLKGMKLTWLGCIHTQVFDLSPLRGMPLTNLNCGLTKVSDLSSLRGMPLAILTCNFTEVADLSPLHGMPLQELYVDATHVSDVSPLKGMNLTAINLTPKNVTKGIDVVRQMKSLRKIGTAWESEQFSPTEFWKRYDAGEFNK